MEKRILVNEYGSRYGVELTFDSWEECRRYEYENYGPDGFPDSHDIWDQIHVVILEPFPLGMSEIDIRIKNFELSNSSELAREFVDRLKVQMNVLINSQFESEEQLHNYVFEHDVLEQTCDEEEADFNLEAARDLQLDMMGAVYAAILK